MERGTAPGLVGAMSETINSPDLAPPVGFSHAVRTADTVYLAGQVAQAPDGTVVGETIAEQFDVAAANLVTALRAAGGEPEHLVSLQVFVTVVGEYRASLRELGTPGASTSGATTRRWACSASPSCLTPRPRSSSWAWR